VPQPYLSLEAELHDAFWADEDGHSEVGLMADFLNLHPGRALEVGSGSGRLMLPLLERGFEIEGLELSEDMLHLCRNRAAAHKLRPALHHGDMSAWQSDSPFQSLLAPAFTLHLAADPAATLRHWHQLLEPGGALYLTLFIPFAELLGELPENQWYRDHAAKLADGRKAWMETRHQIDIPNRLLHREHRYHLSGRGRRTHQSRQTLRWFHPAEIAPLLEKAGFHPATPFTDFDPSQALTDLGSTDFDGILTFHARRV
jgi:SAM-dependent methyltransferase